MSWNPDVISQRHERKGRHEVPTSFELLLGIIDTTFFECFVEMVSEIRGRTRFGRPLVHSHAVIALVYFINAFLAKSQSQAIGLLHHADTFEVLLAELRRKYPSDPLLGPEAPYPTQSVIRHFKERVGPDELRALREIFEVSASELANEMGLGTNSGTWLEPSRSASLYGDGVTIRALSKYGAGDDAFNPATNRRQRRRHSTDAHTSTTGDGRKVFGHKFVLLSARTGNSHEEIILGLAGIETLGQAERDKNPHEKRLAMPLVRNVVARGHRFAMLHYDKALHSADVEECYRLGLHPMIGVNSKENKSTEKVPMGEYKTSKGPKVKVFAWQGAACINDLNGKPIKLDASFLYPRMNRAGGTPYAEYPIPFGANCDTRLWGATFRMPMTSTKGTNLRRAEYIRPLAPGGPRWNALYSRRSAAESLNSVLQRDLLPGKRARSLSSVHVEFDALVWALGRNHRAHMIFQRRQQRSSSPPAA